MIVEREDSLLVACVGRRLLGKPGQSRAKRHDVPDDDDRRGGQSDGSRECGDLVNLWAVAKPQALRIGSRERTFERPIY